MPDSEDVRINIRAKIDTTRMLQAQVAMEFDILREKFHMSHLDMVGAMNMWIQQSLDNDLLVVESIDE